MKRRCAEIKKNAKKGALYCFYPSFLPNKCYKYCFGLKIFARLFTVAYICGVIFFIVY